MFIHVSKQQDNSKSEILINTAHIETVEPHGAGEAHKCLVKLVTGASLVINRAFGDVISDVMRVSR